MTDQSDNEQLPFLTVARLIKDLQDFNQDSEIVAVIMGMEMTIPITNLGYVTSHEGKNLTILAIPYESVRMAIEHDIEKAKNSVN